MLQLFEVSAKYPVAFTFTGRSMTRSEGFRLIAGLFRGQYIGGQNKLYGDIPPTYLATSALNLCPTPYTAYEPIEGLILGTERDCTLATSSWSSYCFRRRRSQSSGLGVHKSQSKPSLYRNSVGRSKSRKANFPRFVVVPGLVDQFCRQGLSKASRHR